MNLDKVKQNTTWNDASGSINTNFEKIRQAILAMRSEGVELDEAQLETYLISHGYTKQEWVLAQNALLEERIENLEQEGGAVNVEGSEFVNVDEDGTISLEIDPQGGLGATEQGLGIVDIPSHLLEGINIDVDSAMSDTSENAVANKVIKKYVDQRAEQAYEQSNEYTDEEISHLEGVLQAEIATKQAILVSGTNIKTINGQSIVGSGNIEIQEGSAEITFLEFEIDTDTMNLIMAYEMSDGGSLGFDFKIDGNGNMIAVI